MQTISRLKSSLFATVTLAIGAACLNTPTLALAQTPFKTRIEVNDMAITDYELDQRARLLAVLRAPGDPEAEARRTLIDDRLKQIEFKRFDFEVEEEEVQLELDDMATSAQLPTEEFLAAMADSGVDEETLRDFLSVRLGWQVYSRGRFLSQARPSEEEIDRAIGQTDRGSVQVKLAEVIIPINAQNAPQVNAAAERISDTTDFDEFSESARRYSVAPSAQNGGDSDWVAVNALPPQLRPQMLAMQIGQVTAPVLLGNVVGLFQLRGIRETGGVATSYAEIDYAVITMNPAQMRAAPTEFLRSVERCDDYYGPARDSGGVTITRTQSAPGNVPRDISLTLARLDPGESAMLPGARTVNPAATDAGGAPVQVVQGVMLCGRTATINQDVDRTQVANALTGQRLEALAEQFLAQKRADAVIIDR